MSKYWSRAARNVEKYIPGEQPQDKKYIKINTNESPYPPSPKAIAAMKAAAGDMLRLYPDPECSRLVDAIAGHFGVEKSKVFVGNGSDELLAFSFMAFFDPGRTIIFPEITYSFYPVYARLFNIDYRLIPQDGGFNISPDAYTAENGGAVICNPNAPTGRYMPLADIEYILQKNTESVVIVDEAYIDFGGESAVALVDRYPNLLVIQTLSKSRSLAGLRVGFAIGGEELIEGLDRIKNSFNSYTMDRIALAGAVEAIRDNEYFEKTRQMVIRTREWFAGELRTLGFNVIDSKANFLFASHPEVAGSEIFAGLKEKGILVRYFNKPKIDNYLRISIGTDEEMEQVAKALKEIIER